MPNQPALGGKMHKVPKGKRWRLWPTRAEVPGLYNVTPHKLAAATKRAKLRAYATSDGNVRFDPKELRAVFGPPNTEREDEPEVEASPVAAGDDGGDDDPPVALDPPVSTVHDLMNEVLAMLREVRKEKVDVLQHCLQPLQHGIRLLEKLLDSALARCIDLEKQRDLVQNEREQLASEAHIRNLELRKVEKAEERRAEIMAMLKLAVPELVMAYVRGQNAPKDASTFLAGLDPKVLDILQEGLEPDDAAKLAALRETLERLRPRKQTPNKEQSNGHA